MKIQGKLELEGVIKESHIEELAGVFVVANNFFDSSVQKAFLPGTPGCFEQYQKSCC